MEDSTTATQIQERDGRAVSISYAKTRLAVIDGPDAGRETEIGQQSITLGTFEGCDFVLKDTTVSRCHAEIQLGANGFLLTDRGSTNGTFVNGYRVGQIYLKPGTVFQVGKTSIRFEPLSERVEVPLSKNDHFGRVLGSSVKMREVFGLLERVAPTALTVVIQGETGTGKEVVARSIHEQSDRANGPFVVVDCGALPGNLIESELYGHVKGAFTGATSTRRGAFEVADHGTVFLDEIGELPLPMQPKLLRVLEEREVRRVGGERPLKVDVRVIAATHRDLRTMVGEGTFREDLYFRLASAVVPLPPLRERLEDIPYLVESFLDRLAEKLPPDASGRKRMPGMTARAVELLRAHDWPGNVRELRNTIERAVHLSSSDRVDVGNIRLDPRSARGQVMPRPGDFRLPFKEAKGRLIDAFERAYLTELLSAHDGDLTAAARDAGIERKHLKNLAKKHDLPWQG